MATLNYYSKEYLLQNPNDTEAWYGLASCFDFLAFTLFSRGKFRESSEALFLTCGQLPAGTFDGYEKAIKYYSENLTN